MDWGDREEGGGRVKKKKKKRERERERKREEGEMDELLVFGADYRLIQVVPHHHQGY